MNVDVTEIGFTHLLASWADNVQPVAASGQRSPDRGVENGAPPSGQGRVPKAHRVFRRLAVCTENLIRID